MRRCITVFISLAYKNEHCYDIFMQNQQLQNSPVIFLLIIWSFFWKALALWRSARAEQKYWFIIFLIPINLLGLLEIIYLLRFAKHKLTIHEIKSWIPKKSK